VKTAGVPLGHTTVEPDGTTTVVCAGGGEEPQPVTKPTAASAIKNQRRMSDLREDGFAEHNTANAARVPSPISAAKRATERLVERAGHCLS
jgi:hypothetical protein